MISSFISFPPWIVYIIWIGIVPSVSILKKLATAITHKKWMYHLYYSKYYAQANSWKHQPLLWIQSSSIHTGRMLHLLSKCIGSPNYVRLQAINQSK